MNQALPYGYLRVAAACPLVRVADIAENVAQIKALYAEAVSQSVALVVCPELAVTGYTLGDLVLQQALHQQVDVALRALAALTTQQPTALIVGAPLPVGNGLYNTAVVLADGRIQGVVPKQFLPSYAEFYEKRWYQTWSGGVVQCDIAGMQVPFGHELLFVCHGVPVGIEICEDLWVSQAPSQSLTEAGALVVVNPSASPELVGKATYRRQLVSIQSAKTMAGYVYAGCDWHESTIDVVMSGHQLIAENGRIVAEREPFAVGQRLTVADIDVAHLRFDRRRDSNRITQTTHQHIQVPLTPVAYTPQPQVQAHPFLPRSESDGQRHERLTHIINIQAHGLAQRIHATHGARLHLGLSGGLDSTLAFLVACRAAEICATPVADMLATYTMPARASSDRTQHNAVQLATLYGVSSQVIPIADLVAQQLQALGHDGVTQDVTYENVQARMRTSILFNMANLHGGMVLGTGDLSETALGWCTFNGDHMSHYHVNAGIPKTLVRHLVRHVADTAIPAVQTVLWDILDTPISPELTTTGDGTVSQKTEDIIGPYELHDFFLYYVVRWGDEPAKIAWLATQAFAGVYDAATITRWLKVFVRRFAGSQFKRSVMPDGPKVGSVALSPRGDWRMPSDLYNTALWQLPE